MSVTIVYLARGMNGGLLAAKNFFDAYLSYPPGCPHELIVISKGWVNVQEKCELERLTAKHSARLINLPDHEYDFGAYMRIAPKLTREWICFLSTNSRPRINGWLNFLLMAAINGDKKVGLVGATGSMGTIAQFPFPPPPTANLRALLLFPLLPLRILIHTLLFLLKLRDFPLFPNPHIRSSTFLVRRDLFTEFSLLSKIPSSKYDAYKLESGRNGLTAFVRRRALMALVAGADGKFYEPEQWVNSRTFRVPEPSNLLVEDRQTTTYDQADVKMKRVLETAAWGIKFS